MYELPVETVEYLEVQLDTLEDLSSSTVEAGFAPMDGESRPATWITGSWDPIFPNRLRVLKPANVVPAGEYRMWYRITDNPEIPVRPSALAVRFI